MSARRTSSMFRVALGLILLAAFGPASLARAKNPSTEELAEINQLSMDPVRAHEAADRLRALLKTDADSSYRVYFNQALLRSLVFAKAPVKEIIVQADTVEVTSLKDPRARVNFFGQFADVMNQREAYASAIHYAQRAVDECPPLGDRSSFIAGCQALMGRAQLGLGQWDKGIATLASSLGNVGDSAGVLRDLGRAYEKRGRHDEAIGAYVRALGVFPGKDTTGLAAVRAIYTKRYKNLDGLDARIEQARKGSNESVALNGRRHEGVAPEFDLPDLEGRKVLLSALKGKVVVVDFWGSWCGPCRAELPHFQTAYERYKDRGVAFVGINWERGESAEQRKKAAKDFLDQNQFSFPTVLDLERKAVEAYNIESFPTVYLIDREGRIRYRNVGFSGDIGEILAAQIESLIQ